MEWEAAVDALVAQVELEGENDNQEPVTLDVSLTALTGWLESKVTEYTEGSYTAMGRRIVFHYPNDYMLTLGTSINPTISHLTEEMKHTDKLPFESMLEENWEFNYRANGWARTHHLTIEELGDFVQLLADEAGEPTLILPVEDRMYDMVEDEPWWEEGDEAYLDHDIFRKLLMLFKEETLQATAYAMGISLMVVSDDAYLPYYCEFLRFQRMAVELDEKHGWFVNLDEHCAACSSGTRQFWHEDNPGREDAPELMTWGQNSQWAYLPNGTMWAEVYIEDEDDEIFLRKLADKHGLTGDWDEGEYEATGSVIFGDD